MTSSNIQGATNITLQFNLTRNIDAGAQDVQAAIAATQAQLPQGMRTVFRRTRKPAGILRSSRVRIEFSFAPSSAQVKKLPFYSLSNSARYGL
jgi:hypothetical protein